MFWVAWKGYNGGKAVSLGQVAQWQAEAYGMHGYPTEAEAEAHPNSVSAFEKIFVNAQLKASNPVQAVQNAASAAAGSVPGLTAVGDFFGRLTEGSTWIRLAEGILGVVLIAIGIARMTHAVPAATKIAKTAGAVALA